jgi:feruloyl-CoA synthase
MQAGYTEAAYTQAQEAQATDGRAGFRPVRLNIPRVSITHRPDGAVLVQPVEALGPYPTRLTEALEHWAAAAPERVFLAQRPRPGAEGWRCVTYAQALASVRAIGAALLSRGLSADRPVAILSGNDIEHALLGLACLHVGVPYAPVSPAYSTVATDFAKLRHILGLLTPGLVFAADGARFARAIDTVLPEGVEVVTTRGAPARGATAFAALLDARADGVDEAASRVGPDTVGKILFTSGSTGLPKGVINTQRMLCSNQAMITWTYPFLTEAPPVMVDWLPWNHTFGGNHNVGQVLTHGGTLYIDEGKPIPSGIAETVRNLREIAPTVYFNVPKGFEELAAYLEREPELCRLFFSRVKMFFYAGAGIAQHVWDAFDTLAVRTTGERIRWMSGLGSTETGPFALSCHPEHTSAGIVGLPVPGCEMKLVPVAGKMEARLRGPSITPGFWRNPAQTATACDEEGFYRMGDALRPVDPQAPEKGYRFDGRISEDFKLATGTWVSVGPLRARLIAALAPDVRDVVIAGHDRDFVAIIAVPEPGAPDDPRAAARVRDRLATLAREATGSATRVLRAIWLDGALSLDAGEITDKGSINQRAVLAHRTHLVDALYAPAAPEHVISVEESVGAA